MEFIGLLAIGSIPTVAGIGLSYSEQRKANERKKDEKYMRRFATYVYCDSKSSRSKEIHGARLVLRDEKVYICKPGQEREGDYIGSFFYIEYPDNERKPPQRGWVSQVRDDPPLLNWIYIDRETMELKYGNRTTSIEHYVGPWDWTEDELGITFEGEEQFVAVENPACKGQWQVYCDPDDDLLKDRVPKKWRKLQISLERVPEDPQAAPLVT